MVILVFITYKQRVEIETKAKSKSVSFLPELWETIETVAEKGYGSNRSAYLRQLVERDLKGLSIGTPQSAFSIEEITAAKHADAALLRAERLARDWLYATDAQKPTAGRALCEFIFDATRRGGPVNPEPTPQERAKAAAKTTAEINLQIDQMIDQAEAAVKPKRASSPGARGSA